MLATKRSFKLSPRKRLAFTAILCFVLYLFLELTAGLIFRWNYGRWYSWADSARDRRAAVLAVTPNYVPEFSFGIVHPYVGFVVSPGWNPDNPEGLYPFLWKEDFTNHPFDGFPSRRPVVQHRSPDTVIVGLFGGSVAEVFYHQGIHLVLDQLRKDVRYRDKQFVVVCLATGGYKQPQQLMALNYVLAQGGELDIAINIDGFNEVALHAAENKQHHVFPAYPRSWSSRVGQVREPEVLKLYGSAALIEADIRRWANLLSCFPLSLSPTCHLVWRARSRILERRLKATMAAIEASQFKDEFVRTGPTYHAANDQQMYADLVRIWDASSRQMRALCLANKIDYYHFLQPNQYVPESKVLHESERKTAFQENYPYRAGVIRGFPLLRQAGQRLSDDGEQFYDLTELFVEVRDPVYSDACCHFGELGNRLMAERIAEIMLRKRKQ